MKLPLEDMVDGIPSIRRPVGRPRNGRHGDKGYDYPDCRELPRERTIVARIPQGHRVLDPARPAPLRHRTLLEWTTRFRRLVRRYEREASHHLGFLRLACALICYRRADRLSLLTRSKGDVDQLTNEFKCTCRCRECPGELTATPVEALEQATNTSILADRVG
jgi:hypothetical protein